MCRPIGWVKRSRREKLFEGVITRCSGVSNTDAVKMREDVLYIVVPPFNIAVELEEGSGLKVSDRRLLDAAM